MVTNIKATGLELTPALRDYVENKLALLEKFIDPKDESAKADVEIGITTHHHKAGDVYKAEINLHLAGENIYFVANESDLYAAIDVMKDKVANDIRNRYAKKNNIFRRGSRTIKKLLRLE